MVTKDEAKSKLQKLIEKYEKEKALGHLKSYTEEDTKKVFIDELFELLGWNIRDRNEITNEENVSKGFVDYGFRLNEIIKFFLEAKKIGISKPTLFKVPEKNLAYFGMLLHEHQV